MNYDLHADSDTLKYYGYKKGKKMVSDRGDLIVAFNSGHGWFWRNLSGGDVLLTLNVSGEYSGIKKVK